VVDQYGRLQHEKENDSVPKHVHTTTDRVVKKKRVSNTGRPNPHFNGLEPAPHRMQLAYLASATTTTNRID